MRGQALCALIAMLVAAPAIAAGPASSGKKGPAGIPFDCSDGRSLRIVYGDQGPRRTAKLAFDGGETLKLVPVPAYENQRYATDAAPGQRLIWATDGIKAWLLSDAAGGPMGEETPLATCQRHGWDGAGAEAKH